MAWSNLPQWLSGYINDCRSNNKIRRRLAHQRPFHAEPLEKRVYLSQVFSANINFEPPSSAVVAGSNSDTGLPYMDQGNGYTYGWSVLQETNANNFGSFTNSGAPDARFTAYQNLATS